MLLILSQSKQVSLIYTRFHPFAIRGLTRHCEWGLNCMFGVESEESGSARGGLKETETEGGFIQTAKGTFEPSVNIFTVQPENL